MSVDLFSEVVVSFWRRLM